MREAHAAGQLAFGENYIQEAVEKMALLQDLPLQWHCIGPIQSNKTRLVAQHFDWAHTVDRLKIAQRLSEQRPEGKPPLSVCIQVNVDGGATKSGVAPDEAAGLAREVAQLPALRLRGLMTIPEPAPDFDTQLAGARPGRRAVPAAAGRGPAAGHAVHGHDRRPGSGHRRRQHDGAGGHGDLRRPPAGLTALPPPPRAELRRVDGHDPHATFPRRNGSRPGRRRRTVRYFRPAGGTTGLTLPQSADSHLPAASMVMVSGLPSTVLVVVVLTV